MMICFCRNNKPKYLTLKVKLFLVLIYPIKINNLKIFTRKITLILSLLFILNIFSLASRYIPNTS